MRTTSIPFATMFGLLLLFCTSDAIHAQNPEDEGVFENCAWTLTQLTQLQLDDDGRLELKRDHWDAAAKRPVNDPTSFNINRRFGNDAEPSPVDKLFNRLVIEAGSGGISTSTRNQDKETSWDGTTSEGRLLISETEMVISVIERTGENRRFYLRTLGQDVELTFLSTKGELFQLLQSTDAVRLCSVRSGEPTVVTGATFAHMVQRNKEYFASLDWPPFIGELPVKEALEVTLAENAEPGTFPPPQFSDTEFLNEQNRPYFQVFSRFRFLNGRLQFNDFFGNADVLAKESETLAKEYGESLDRAIQRLKDIDAPVIQVGKIQARFGAWKSSAPNDAAAAGKYAPLLDAFQELQSHAGNRSASSSRGTNSFRQSFESTEISASLSRDSDALSFRISTDPASVDFSQDKAGFVLTASDVQSLLMVRESSDGSTALMFLHGDFCRVWKAGSWFDLVSEHEAEFRMHIVPVMDHYALSGLDPFHPDVIKAAVTWLRKDLPQPLDLQSLSGNTDAYVVPLLSSEKYLQLLAARVSPEEKELVAARLKAIAGK